VKHRGSVGFTLIEILLAVLIGGLLFLAVARLGDSVVRVDAAARGGSDARALQTTTDRVIRRALEQAGAGMMTAPNLAGIGVVVGSVGGAASDTLTVLRADGDQVDVAARGCPGGTDPCVALAGDHSRQFRAGDVVVVGTRTLGMRAYQITETPSVFYAPCGADCPERLVCSVSAGPSWSFKRVVGSVTSSGGASTAPCTQPYMPDGSSCQEVLQTSSPEPIRVPVCRLAVAQSPFTAIHLADRTSALGFPDAPAMLLRSGAGGSPSVRMFRVLPSRFWVKAGSPDTLLVRQNGIGDAGQWNDPVPVASPVVSMAVETLHSSGWHRGTGVGPGSLSLSTTNPNLSWREFPASSATEAGFAFVLGHHSVRAVRVRIRYAVLNTRGMREVHEIALYAPTPSILEGGTRDNP
jgi:type II secretory pathway pseudopilin PulG